MKKKFPAVLMILHLLALGAVVTSLLTDNNDKGKINIFLIASAALLFICIVYTIIYFNNSMRRISRMNKHLESSAAEFINYLPAPIAVIDGNKQFVWYNQIFAEKISLGQDIYGHDFESFVKMDVDSLISNGSAICSVKGAIYNVTAEKFDKNDMSFLVLYFHDNTNYYAIKRSMDESHPNVVIITIDNYDEIMQNAKESEKAQTSVETEKLIENFMSKTTGFIKKASSNTFFAIIENRHLNDIVDSKFKILEAARNIKIAGKYPLTFSIGVGQGASSLSESENLARQCLDMALGRGGDQAVIKTDSGYRFFGGVSKGVEKRSRSKTRIIANAMQDLIKNSDRIFIMGHRFGDLDSVGSACGLAGAVKMLGKEAYIAVDRNRNLATNLIDLVDSETNCGLFLTPADAQALISPNDMLIVVDTHNKDFIESRELYDKAHSVVVVDHHRKTVNFIDDAVIFHHEPYASSASEMVTEIIQYFRYESDEKLAGCYTDALLAGIMLDTKNFVMRTGVRTFEAAAYLKKLGADTIAVKHLFSSSIDSYKRKTQIVASAKIHNNCAIAATDLEADDIRVVAPQAADELLNISDVDASFVIYRTSSTLNISARSLGGINVQVIMEQLGGGGHQTMAAAQLENTSVEDALKSLIYAIDDYQQSNMEL